MQAYINGKPVQFEEGETILQTAKKHGHFIPTLCEMAEIDHVPGTCRVCVVEIIRTNDPEHYLVTSCNTPIEENMHILTRTKWVRDTQRFQVQLLLADHKEDCASCNRHGDCELQDIAQFVGLRRTPKEIKETNVERTYDHSSPSIVRDMTRCIRCFRCVKVCRDIQGTDILVPQHKGVQLEMAPRDFETMGSSACVSCGQCTLVCPVGALSVKDDMEKVIDYLYDLETTTVFQFAPAIRIALGEEFMMPPGSIVTNKIVTALKRIGADIVLDTSFAADLVVMEEGSELLHRLRNKETLPMFTSCSPGWVNYLEKNYPQLITHLSSVRSPQQCFGSIAKTYLAEKMQLDPAKMRVISIMPCTAKKEEAQRPEFIHETYADVDAVLTTREFAELLRREGIWLPDLEDTDYDNPFMSDYTGAGVIFGTTGGVAEAAVRTLYALMHGKPYENLEIKPVRGIEKIREAEIDLGTELGMVKIAIAHGLKAAKTLVEQVAAGESPYSFIEFMACPGGCMGGGGQPRSKKNYQTHWHARQQAIYQVDKDLPIRQSHENPMIKVLYDEFLGEPLSHTSHELLHTRYRDRKKIVKHTITQIWREIQEK